MLKWSKTVITKGAIKINTPIILRLLECCGGVSELGTEEAENYYIECGHGVI